MDSLETVESLYRDFFSGTKYDCQSNALFFQILFLKWANDQFFLDRNEMKKDFLIRGICEREVEFLLEEPGLYKSFFLPMHTRWSALMKWMTQASDSELQLFPVCKEINCCQTGENCISIFEEVSFPTEIVLKLVEMMDVLQLNEGNEKIGEFIIEKYNPCKKEGY
ncbi:hypothetical protein [Falsibacillus albus]|uniref:Uncharacterized protein n=1 Tax=Falsibacillus albus TaxID=2478915 RepID=A0A3L7K221_9BACI|nr:hypothetical protein [Falsibacillus albus]RLQ97137.1 hypothetical protein D9X91_02995 [Falsibacillus albus]